ncbi:Formin-binding protein 4 [Spatholobus suberectus]|nr:Formin-binding protein 4 [Spatholobus suberectus]
MLCSCGLPRHGTAEEPISETGDPKPETRPDATRLLDFWFFRDSNAKHCKVQTLKPEAGIARHRSVSSIEIRRANNRMGKRKERRLAALSNAGRRVKLDLFAEPSGELGGSTLHGDAGGDTDSQHRDGLPNSPSSSGQQPQNPLLLLGQYSDDEGDDGSSKGHNDANVQSPILNEEAKAVLDEGSKDLDISVSVDLDTQNNGQQNTVQNSTSLDVEYSERNESDGAAGNLQNEMVSKDQIDVSESFDEQVVTDVGLGWKMVMHEESQRYYYWNIETGETSWEVPQVLANDSIPHASVSDKTESAAVGNSSNVLSTVMQDASAAFIIDGSLEATVISHKELYGHGSQMNGGGVECTNQNQGSDVNGNELTRNDGHMSLSDERDHSSLYKFSVGEQQLDIDFPSRLVKQSESLLERLKSLKKSKENLQGLDSLSKYMLEIEIRLSDFRSLASYGSSLLPFWVHSDRKMKILESLINDDLLQTANSTHEVEDKHVPVSEELGDQQNGMVHESEVDHNKNQGSLLTSDVSNGSQVDASAVVLKGINNKISTNGQHVPLSSSPGSHMETGVETNVEANLNPQEPIHKHGYVGEDVDMDVDMEVEDMNSSGNTNVIDVPVAKDSLQTDQLVQLNPPVDYHSVLTEEGEFVVPPPPDDEWIPPPPPDNEQVPPPPPPDNDQVPPPPGDPLAPYSSLPSYTETGQPLSYAQYSLPYPVAAAEYYGQTAAEIPSSNIYGQVAMPPAQLYYNSAVPNMYSENPQVMTNPTDPVAYYEVQDGAGSKSIPAININDSGVGGTNRASSDLPSTSSIIHAPATVSADEAVSLPAATAESAAENNASSLVSKAQTKVVRSRKRAVAAGSSLKSNKKVSSLVDKWKAAKEELLEEEEEPDSVYEVLERKRQREIEEWHAKQIAGGEAKDNANFQPLGGDWRQKVKRKRAQAARESVSASQDAIDHNQQQPNLTELSKGLPTNWQAYWDNSTKQVYYGNTITSETTWTRPTR